MNRRALLMAALAAPLASLAAETQPSVIEQILSTGSARLRETLANARALELQICYTRVLRTGSGVRLQPHQFPARAPWFASASLVKLPLAALLLEQLASLDLGLDANLAFPGMPACAQGAAQLRVAQPVRRLIERAIVVSDDSAYNALYDFLGPQAIADRLAQLGYQDSRIQARFGTCGPELSRVTGPWQLSDARGKVLAEQAQRAAFQLRSSAVPINRGNAWMQAGRRMAGAKDFSQSNALTLAAAQQMLLALSYPEEVPAQQRFALREADRQFLLSRLRMTPAESQLSSGAERALKPGHFKLLGVGDGQWPKGLLVTNKVGWAYGYLSDVTHLRLAAQECFVSCAMYLNRDAVLNDGIYEYEQIGRPFMAEAGRLLLAAS